MQEYTRILKESITKSKLTIFEKLAFDHELYIPTEDLEVLLRDRLIGESLAGLPLRTRSKVVKILVCEALGYPVPKSFKKTQPRFLGQNFDTYVQKTNNLQIWNEDISPNRRYIIIALNDNDIISKITAITGNQLSVFDKTGTITKKYQAKFTKLEVSENELYTLKDTKNLLQYITGVNPDSFQHSPSKAPAPDDLLTVAEIYRRLVNIVGKKFGNLGAIQERNRGVELQKLACLALGYSSYEDTGQFPDVFNQILEIKLQTSPTIDLGLVLPTSEEHLYTGKYGVSSLQPRDARYAIFYGEITNEQILIKKLAVITGESFFDRFQKFEGRVVNAKIQLRLPNFFFTHKPNDFSTSTSN